MFLYPRAHTLSSTAAVQGVKQKIFYISTPPCVKKCLSCPFLEQLGSFGLVYTYIFPAWATGLCVLFVFLEARKQIRRVRKAHGTRRPFRDHIRSGRERAHDCVRIVRITLADRVELDERSLGLLLQLRL